MISLNLDSVKQTILDAKKVMDAADRATIRALSKFGAYVRQRSKTSIRPRKGPSNIGEPPSSHMGLIRDNILFAVESAQKNVVIGPMQLNRVSPTALHSLEEGGESLIMRKGKPVGVMIWARPFMRPAFDKELEKAAYLWEAGLK